MGHADLQIALAAQFERAGHKVPDLATVLSHPTYYDTATQQYTPQLNNLRSSWSKNSKWKKYDGVVKKAHTMIHAAYGDKLDRSGVPLIAHPLSVADDSFRLAKVLGFSNKEATTVWIAALFHDYLEDATDKTDFLKRYKQMREAFDSHDPDITNLAIMMMNPDKSQPYFDYVQRIGVDISEQSTTKARIAVWLIKNCDSRHNARPDRNIFLDTKQTEAEKLLASQNPDDHIKAQEILDWIKPKRIKIDMYKMNCALMIAKIKGALGLPGGLPHDALMIDMLLRESGFQSSLYQKARETGLGPLANGLYETLLAKKEPQAEQKQNHTVLIVKHHANGNASVQVVTDTGEVVPFVGGGGGTAAPSPQQRPAPGPAAQAA